MSQSNQPLSDADNHKRLVVGYTFESVGRTITETDIVNFAGISGDFNRLHVNHEYASKTRYGQRIAHGLLVLAVLSGLTTQTLEYRMIEPNVLALVNLTCTFPKPTFIGDTLFARVTITKRVPTASPSRDEVIFCREAVNQRGEVVLQANFTMHIRITEAA